MRILVWLLLLSICDRTKSDQELCANFSSSSWLDDSENNVIATPNFPSFYPPNLECIRVIKAPIGYAILLDFGDQLFEIEQPESIDREPCPFDYLEIRDGPFGYSPLIGRMCGYQFPPKVSAVSGSMWLMFKSDNSLHFRGFRAIHHFVRLEASISAPTMISDCSFRNEVSDDYRWLGTEALLQINANNSNDQRIDCIWRLESLTSQNKIRLFFDELDVASPNECELNRVEIFSKSTARARLLKQICGKGPVSFDTDADVTHVRIYLAEKEARNANVRIGYINYIRDGACDQHLFRCGDGTCISKTLVCNGRPDCPTELDERNCRQAMNLLASFGRGPYLGVLIAIVSLIVAVIVGAIALKARRRRRKSIADQEHTDHLTSIFDSPIDRSLTHIRSISRASAVNTHRIMRQRPIIGRSRSEHQNRLDVIAQWLETGRSKAASGSNVVAVSGRRRPTWTSDQRPKKKSIPKSKSLTQHKFWTRVYELTTTDESSETDPAGPAFSIDDDQMEQLSQCRSEDEQLDSHKVSFDELIFVV